jgi:hypothetical protein
MSDSITERLQGLREGFMALTEALRIMLENQRLHGEMLQRILAAVTEEPPESNLDKLLAALVAADHDHADKLDRVLAAVTQAAD